MVDFVHFFFFLFIQQWHVSRSALHSTELIYYKSLKKKEKKMHRSFFAVRPIAIRDLNFHIQTCRLLENLLLKYTGNFSLWFQNNFDCSENITISLALQFTFSFLWLEVIYSLGHTIKSEHSSMSGTVHIQKQMAHCLIDKLSIRHPNVVPVWFERIVSLIFFR